MALFYVYRYRDPRPKKKGVPIYIGKGTIRAKGDPYRRANRWQSKISGQNKLLLAVLTKLLASNRSPIIEIVRVLTNEERAFSCERYWIQKYGRRATGTGTLLNLTEGGEGMLGARFKLSSETLKSAWNGERRQQQSARQVERLSDPVEREKKIEEFRAGLRRRWAKPEERVGLAERNRRLWRDPAYRARVSKKISIKVRGRPCPEATKIAVGAAARKRWEAYRRASAKVLNGTV